VFYWRLVPSILDAAPLKHMQYVYQWRINRVCSAHGTIAGGPDEPCVGREGGGLLESLHTGALQPCYAATPLISTVQKLIY